MMKAHRLRALARSIAALLVTCSMLLLSGCLITVTPYIGGQVSSDLGADCESGCRYQLEAGDSFARTFTATPLPGNEFVRWSDSLGDNVAICKQPTAPQCTINLAPLHPLLEGLELDVVAQFRAVDGDNINRIGFKNIDFNSSGVLKQISAVEWLEQYPGQPPVYYYLEKVRGASAIRIHDAARDVTLTIDLAENMILSQDGAAAPVEAKEILNASAAVTAWLASRVSYGDSAGVYKGDYIQTGKTTWVDRVHKTQLVRYTYEQVGRDDSTVYLRHDSRGIEIQLNIAESTVYSVATAAAEEEVPAPLAIAIIQRVTRPVDGRSASKVSYSAQPGGTIAGNFLYRGGVNWEQIASGSGTPLASYEMFQRTPQEIILKDQDQSRTVVLKLSQGIVTEGLPPLHFPFEIHKIVAVE